MVAALRLIADQADLDPTARRLARIEHVQATLRGQLERCSPTNCEAETSRKLLEAIESYVPGDLESRHKCEERVRKRIDVLKLRPSLDFASGQQRDLLIIIFFATGGKVSQRLRHEACALLTLHGSETNRKIVCDAFPGLREAFQV
jgi:hypothetical protein